MPKIFISYRRADSKAYAGRLHDRLVTAFGPENVFMDVNNDNIPLGRDFRGVLRESVARCDVLLAIIGKQWMTIADENGARRLDNPNDFVRIEIESALQRDTCVVIPLTVDGAFMPAPKDLPDALRELSFKNGTVMRDDPDFHPDVDKLIRALGGNSGNQNGGNKPISPTPKPTQPLSYNVYEAIDRYHTAYEQRQWELARTILREIITNSPVLPRTFNALALEKDIVNEIKAEEREREYSIVRRMAKAQSPNAARIWEALQAFWESYSEYDPDNLARFKLILAQQYFDHAEDHRKKGDYDRAIADYTEAIRLNPQDATTYNRRGFSYDEKKEYDRAIADYTEAIRLNPQYAIAYNNRGLSYQNVKKEYDRAIADYTEAIRLNPQYATAYNNRGASYYYKKEYDRAIADYEAALRINPDRTYTLQSLQNARDALRLQKK